MCANMTPAEWIAQMTIAIGDRVDQVGSPAINDYDLMKQTNNQSNDQSNNQSMNDSDDDGYFDTKEADSMMQYNESIKQLNSRSNSRSNSQSRRLSVSYRMDTESDLINQTIDQSFMQSAESPDTPDVRQSVVRSLDILKAFDPSINPSIDEEAYTTSSMSIGTGDLSLRARSTIDASSYDSWVPCTNHQSMDQSNNHSNNQTNDHNIDQSGNEQIELSNAEVRHRYSSQPAQHSNKHSSNGSLKQSIDQLMHDSLNSSLDSSLHQSINQTINNLTVHSIEESNRRPINQSLDQSIEQLTEQSMKRSFKQPNIQSTDQSMRCRKFAGADDDDFYDCDDCCCQLCSYFVSNDNIQHTTSPLLRSAKPQFECPPFNQTDNNRDQSEKPQTSTLFSA